MDITKRRWCSNCQQQEWFCKLNPCKERMIQNSSKQKMKQFSTYSYGSGHILNSCHQDTFLLVFHKFYSKSLKSTTPSEIVQILLQSYELFCRKKFHESKILFWKFLQDRTDKGSEYYKIGMPAVLSAIFERVFQYMNENEKDKHYLKYERIHLCSDYGHKQQRIIHDKLRCINLNNVKASEITKKNNFDICKYIETLYNANNFQEVKCHHHNCKSSCSVKNRVLNSPDCFSVQVLNEHEYITPNVTSTVITIA